MEKDWMKLDNAAKIYPLIASEYITTVFRFSATLDIPVNKDSLKKALNDIIKRFPYYKVTLKKGFFWFYLEENKKDLNVYEDIYMPCGRMIKDETNGYLFRVLYKEKTIAVEFNHILGDGTACLIFLSTLVYQYLSIEGYEVSRNEWIKDIEEAVTDEEYEDSHSLLGKKHFKTHNNKIHNIKGVFHMKDKLISRNNYHVVKGIVDSHSLYQTAKQFDASITVFLTALYMEAMLEIQKEEIKNVKRRKPVAIQVPINMRNRLQKKTMRNFSLYITPYLMPDKTYTLTDIITFLSDRFTEETEINYLLSLMVQNYKTEKSVFVRLLPLALKGLVTPLIYKAVGVDTYSATISNIGRIKLPDSIEKHVVGIDFLLGPCPLTKTTCAVTGYQDTISISFGRNIKEAKVEKKFFRKLVQLGVKVNVEYKGGEK